MHDTAFDGVPEQEEGRVTFAEFESFDLEEVER